MTMTPWNMTHGQWSKNLTMVTDILESAPWSMVKVVILWSNFVVRSTVYHFDHRKFVFHSWPWSIMVFLVKFCGKIFRLTILTMENLDFGHGHGRNFDHLTMVKC